MGDNAYHMHYFSVSLSNAVPRTPRYHFSIHREEIYSLSLSHSAIAGEGGVGRGSRFHTRLRAQATDSPRQYFSGPETPIVAQMSAFASASAETSSTRVGAAAFWNLEKGSLRSAYGLRT